MPQTLPTEQTAPEGATVAIVVSRFHETITRNLLDGACETLLAQGVEDDDITVAWVPGAFELPLAVQTAADTETFDAIIALGCVIRGETDHFDYVCDQAAAGLMDVTLSTSTPVAFGVLTVDTKAQAMARAGGEVGNKGADAALTALEMLNVLSALNND